MGDGLVGVLTPHVGRWWFGEVIAGLDAVLRPAGYDVVLHQVPDPQARAAFFASLPPDAEAFGLTTVHQPAHDCGARLAAGLVTDLVAHRGIMAARSGPPAAPRVPAPAHPPRHLLNDFTRLVVRESTAAAPTSPPTSSATSPPTSPPTSPRMGRATGP